MRGGGGVQPIGVPCLGGDAVDLGNVQTPITRTGWWRGTSPTHMVGLEEGSLADVPATTMGTDDVRVFPPPSVVPRWGHTSTTHDGWESVYYNHRVIYKLPVLYGVIRGWGGMPGLWGQCGAGGPVIGS